MARPVRGRLSRVIPSVAERICALRRSNPWVLSHRSMRFEGGATHRRWATEKSLAKLSACADGLTGRDGQKAGVFMCNAQGQILSRGFGRFSSLNLALVGSFHLVTGGTGAIPAPASGRKTRRRKAQHMNGAKALGSKLQLETVPNSEKPSLLGKGTLLVSCPRNHTIRVETMPGREAGTWSDGVEVGPPSDVTIGAKSSLIREGPQLPPVVRRCRTGNAVFQRLGTGRVA